MRLVKASLVALAALLAQTGQGHAPGYSETKLEIYVAMVKAPTAEIEAGRQQWFQNLLPGLESFLFGLSIPGQQQRPFSEVHLRPFDYNDEPDRSRLEGLSKSNPDYFYILRSVGGDASGGIEITNTFYFGSNQGDLPDPVLTLSQVMRKETYQASRDAVTMATVYALAVNSFRGHHVQSGCGYLHEASLLNRGIKTVSGDIVRLSTALSKTAAKEACRG